MSKSRDRRIAAMKKGEIKKIEEMTVEELKKNAVLPDDIVIWVKGVRQSELPEVDAQDFIDLVASAARREIQATVSKMEIDELVQKVEGLENDRSLLLSTLSDNCPDVGCLHNHSDPQERITCDECWINFLREKANSTKTEG